VCLVAFVVIPVSVRLALLPRIPVPQPAIQDEFSYLLAADTFASGRLTNEPHPMWVFFESVHIIQQPTYMSKYPPLTGLILALGQKVFAQPWIGILLSVGALCGAVGWALQGWLPPQWAFIGTTVAVLKVGILSYWSESYWGGTGAAIGGALLVGSVPRVLRRPGICTGIPAAVGVALLANSRPFEGLVLTTLALGYVVWRICRESVDSRSALVKLTRLAAPLAVVMIPVGSWMAYYNYRVTGNALLLPYIVHQRQYASAGLFLWNNPVPPPVYRHEALRRAWIDFDLDRKLFQHEHFAVTRALFYGSLVRFYLGLPLLAVVLAFVIGCAKTRRIAPALWLAVAFFVVLGGELEFNPHYAAPATALVYIVVAAALRSLRHWRWIALRARPVLFGAALLLIGSSLVWDLFQPEHQFLFDKREFKAERAKILDLLARIPGKKLVLVRYGPSHDVNREWVYNRADIDGPDIVWARSMGQRMDEELISYFKNRRVWFLYENGPAMLTSYDKPGN